MGDTKDLLGHGSEGPPPVRIDKRDIEALKSQIEESRSDERGHIPKFDGNDFAVWKAQVEAFLISKDKDRVLNLTKPRRIVTGTDEQKILRDREIQAFEKADRYVRSLLLLSLDAKYVKLVLKCKTSRELWERLCATHEQKSIANKQALQSEFFDIAMQKDEKVHEFIARAEYKYTQLEDIGVSYDESVLVGRIIAGLPRRFSPFVTAWSNLDESKQNLVELMARLGAEEQNLNRFKKPDAENALLGHHKYKGEYSSGRNRGGRGGRGGRPSRGRGRSWRGRSSGEQRERLSCWTCGSKEHLKRNCPDKEKSKNDGKDKKETSNVTEEQAETAVMIADEATVADSSEQWVVDTGATSHMTFSKSDFVSYNRLATVRLVRFGGNEIGRGIATGNVKLVAMINGNRSTIVLHDVLHVPELRRRLLSISSATSRGYRGNFSSDKIILMDEKGAIKLVAVRQDNLYVAVTAAHEHSFNVAESVSALWHERFGHINLPYLIKTASAVEGLTKLRSSKAPNSGCKVIECDGCAMGKLQRVHTPVRTTPRAGEVGECLHVDIGGPVGAKTLSNKSYYLLAKDEFSNYRFIATMKSRDETYDELRKIVARVKADTKQSVRNIRSDQGSEFCSRRMQEFFTANNIAHKTVAPFTPASNGFIERDNKTLMSGVRSMLYLRNLPTRLWGEAALTLVYLLNRSINNNTVDITPFEHYFGFKPKVSHLRVFGCLVMVKTQTKKRSGYQKKVEERSKRAVMVGYEDNYTYRIFDPQENKVIATRDVIFDESRTFYEVQSREDGSLSSDEEPEPDDNEAEFNEEAVIIEGGNEPQNYQEAISSPQASEWIAAMQDEFNSLLKNKTWELCDLPPDRKAITSRWVYKIKLDSQNRINRFKARLVARGFTQRAGLDYTETFSPVVRLETVRILLCIAAQLNLAIKQLDVKTAFLHGELREDIYMIQPEGFERGSKVCKLKKSLYGLKQASLEWNRCFTDFLKSFKLKPLRSDTCVYINESCNITKPTNSILILCIYVDDGLIMSNDEGLMTRCLTQMQNRFEITVGKPDAFVGLRLNVNHSRIEVDQVPHIERMAACFKLETVKEVATPMVPGIRFSAKGVDSVESQAVDVPYKQLLGTLLYISTGTRYDITYAVNNLARFSVTPHFRTGTHSKEWQSI